MRRYLPSPPDEKKFLRVIVEESQKNVGPLTSVLLYKSTGSRFPIIYSIFSKWLEKFDTMNLIESRNMKARGKFKEIIMRYEVEEFRRFCDRRKIIFNNTA